MKKLDKPTFRLVVRAARIASEQRALPPVTGSESPRARAIRKALTAKGYNAGEIEWSPISRSGIMCGPEGGWAVNIRSPRPHNVESYILGYSAAEVMERIAELPLNSELNESPPVK